MGFISSVVWWWWWIGLDPTTVVARLCVVDEDEDDNGRLCGNLGDVLLFADNGYNGVLRVAATFLIAAEGGILSSCG